ncbi:MAG: FtsX-like permease family protein [Bdellovibrionales bacterium]|nr:FtsX-like permease family protein [Bdellovibrionales bacterium]
MNSFLFIWLKRFSLKNLFHMENAVSLLGLALAVMCLAITMTVMSSYETTLRKSLISHTGHINLIRVDGKKASFSDIKPYVKEMKVLPFISAEALALSDGELSGVLIEGLPLDRVDQVLNLRSRVTEGSLMEKPFQAVIGKKLAHRFNLQINSSFYLAVPNDAHLPQLKKLQVAGIADLGQYDFNSRYIAVSLNSAKELLNTSELTGFRLLLNSEKHLDSHLKQLREHLSASYLVQDWKYIHKNLFEAIQMEKVIIFIVLLILIIAAGFNMSNQMLLQVLKRFHDIGILKAMGARPAIIVQMFLIRTAIVSILGIMLGFLTAVAVCYGLFGFYNVWGYLIPSDVYQLNQIILDFRGWDFLSIFVFSILICLFSSWIPIRKALKLSPCEGLRFN